MALKFQTPTGMHDILEKDLVYFNKIEKVCKDIASFYNYNKIETPILEQTEIFEKGVGMSSDIVEKEMYSLRTKGGDRLTLRPEITAGVVRAYIQNGMQSLPKPVNLWYKGPCFRHERPQAGRYRQFNQFGFESFGVESPVVDAKTILIFYNVLKSLGFKNLIIEVNSIGDKQCRPYFKKSLTSYLRSRQASLCPTCKRRIRVNPLRILDCKQEKCQEVTKGAPQFVDHLCKECHAHFKSLLEFLDELELPYNLNPNLVRGLDYYTKTVFEIYQDTPEGKRQGALAGGGRYDDLMKLLGGKDTPACGGASGMERLINLIKPDRKATLSDAGGQKTVKPPTKKASSIFLAQVGELARRRGLKLLNEFQEAKIKMSASLHRDSLSVQLKMADKEKVKYVLILGQKEAIDGNIIIREMKSGKQKTIALEKIIKEMKKKI